MLNEYFISPLNFNRMITHTHTLFVLQSKTSHVRFVRFVVRIIHQNRTMTSAAAVPSIYSLQRFRFALRARKQHESLTMLLGTHLLLVLVLLLLLLLAGPMGARMMLGWEASRTAAAA